MRALTKTLLMIGAVALLLGSLTIDGEYTELNSPNPPGNAPTQIVYDSENGYLYAASNAGVLVINGNTDSVLKTIPLEGGYYESNSIGNIVYDPQNGYVYVATEGYKGTLGPIQVIDGRSNTIIANISAPDLWIDGGLSYNPQSGNIYTGSTNVWINVKTNSIQNTSQSPFSVPIGIEYDPENGYLYLTSNGVEVLNPVTNQQVSKISTGGDSVAIVYDTVNGFMYVANVGYSATPPPPLNGSVSIINADTNSLVNTINLPLSAQVEGYDSQNGDVLIAGGNHFAALINGSTNTIVANFTLGLYPRGVAFDPLNGNYYVTNEGADTISVISDSSAKIVGTISLIYFAPLIYIPLTFFVAGGAMIACGLLVSRKKKSNNAEEDGSPISRVLKRSKAPIRML